MCEHLVVCEAGIAPYVAAVGFEPLREGQQGCRLIERVATRECDVEIVVVDNLEDFVDSHVVAGIDGPCVGVVTPGTLMVAPGKIYRCAQPGPVDTRTLDYVDYAKCVICVRHGR